MKKIFILFLIIAAAGVLSAQTASVGSVSGKVEIQEPGSFWKTASPGMVIASNSKISTGFASEAKIVMDNADITVRPLTRMTLEEYSSAGDTTTTKLFLGSGRIRTDVKRSDNRINDFTVRSPVATAAVRGTSFEFDGVRLEVTEGNVDFYSSSGAKVSVPAGAASEASEDGAPVPPAEQKEQENTVSASTSTGEESATTNASQQEEETFASARESAQNEIITQATLIIAVE